MKQKLGIAQAIMEKQDIILLDEPFNGLDYSSVDEIRGIIRELKQEGRTILLTSHIQSSIDDLCDMFYIIQDKQLELLTDTLKKQYFLS